MVDLVHPCDKVQEIVLVLRQELRNAPIHIPDFVAQPTPALFSPFALSFASLFFLRSSMNSPAARPGMWTFAVGFLSRVRVKLGSSQVNDSAKNFRP